MLTPSVTIYTQGELRRVTYFQWNVDSSTKRLTHRVSLGFKEEIPYLRYHFIGSVWGFSDGYIPSPADLYSLAQNRTVGKIFASRLVRAKWIHMLTHMHGKTLCKL